MRFMTLVKSVEGSGPPPVALMMAIGELGKESAAAGLGLRDLVCANAAAPQDLVDGDELLGVFVVLAVPVGKIVLKFFR